MRLGWSRLREILLLLLLGLALLLVLPWLLKAILRSLQLVHLASLVLSFPKCPCRWVTYLVPGTRFRRFILDRTSLTGLAAVATGGTHRIAFLGSCQQNVLVRSSAATSGRRVRFIARPKKRGNGLQWVEVRGKVEVEETTYQFSSPALMAGSIACKDAMRVAVLHVGRCVEMVGRHDEQSCWGETSNEKGPLGVGLER